MIPADGPSIVLALHDGTIDVATLPFVAVAACSRMPLACASQCSGTRTSSASSRFGGDVTLQSHLGAGTLTEHATLYGRAVAFIGVLGICGGAEMLETPSGVPSQLVFDVK